MDALKADEQIPIRGLIPIGQVLDVIWFRSAQYP